MSRCFPFPPPGYEKKPTVDDPDLLKKEKRKEKKHKKDKEKKDGKEKREKDRSEGKHKDKKDKKDKHRDKKKDKEKSKTSIPDEKNVHAQFQGYNGEFPHQNGDSFTNRIKVGDTQNFNFVQELDRRIRDEEKGTGSHQFAVESRKDNINKGKAQKTDERQVAAFGGNVALSRVNGATPPLDNRRIDKMKESGSDLVAFGGNVAVSRVNGATPPLDNKKIDKMKERGSDAAASGSNVAAFGGNVAVSRVNGITPLLDNRRIDKMKERGSDVAAFGGNVASRINGVTPPPSSNKRVEKVKEKGSDDKRKNKDRDKELEKLKAKSEEKKVKRDKNNNNNIMKSDSVNVANNLSGYPPGNSFQGVKRKAMETNGVSHENEPRPNKMARPISNISPENGRKLDFIQNPSPNLLDKQGASLNTFNNITSKAGQRVNDLITSQSTSVSAKKPPIPAVNHAPFKPSPIKSPPVVAPHIAAQSPPASKPPPNPIAFHQLPPLSSPPPLPPPTRPKPPPVVVNKPVSIPKKKPPHPDTKYLTQILSVPKPDPWCDFADQEWLYSSKAGPTSKKPPVNEPEVQVWSEAKHIESVDVCALPYVIPY